MRRTTQALLALALRGVFVVTFGVLYAIIAIIASLLALASGVYIATALAAGLAWPVVALAYVLYTTREVSRRAAEASPPRTSPLTRESSLPRIEDAEDRERGN